MDPATGTKRQEGLPGTESEHQQGALSARTFRILTADRMAEGLMTTNGSTPEHSISSIRVPRRDIFYRRLGYPPSVSFVLYLQLRGLRLPLSRIGSNVSVDPIQRLLRSDVSTCRSILWIDGGSLLYSEGAQRIETDRKAGALLALQLRSAYND